MDRKCEFCEKYYDDILDSCPYCGCANPRAKKEIVSATGDEGTITLTDENAGAGLVETPEIPETLEQLQAYFDRLGLSSEKTRFFVGVDYKKPKAFGIYRDQYGKVTLYKNKANGERAVRYEGYDEAFAVRELYDRFQAEVENQISHRLGAQSGQRRNMSRERQAFEKGRVTTFLEKRPYVFPLIIVLVIALVFFLTSHRKNGYYRYGSDYYYSLSGDWYEYSGSGWSRAYSVPSALSGRASDYFYSSSYPRETGITNFSSTTYYYNWEHESDHGYNNNDDNDWDYDDWDPGVTDWDSDW